MLANLMIFTALAVTWIGLLLTRAITRDRPDSDQWWWFLFVGMAIVAGIVIYDTIQTSRDLTNSLDMLNF